MSSPCDFAVVASRGKRDQGARPERLRQPAVAAEAGVDAYDSKRDALSFGTIAAVLRAKLSPMPVLGKTAVAKFGPIAVPHPRPANREYFEKPWILNGLSIRLCHSVRQHGALLCSAMRPGEEPVRAVRP